MEGSSITIDMARYDLLYREVTSGIWAILSLALALVFLRFVVREVRTEGWTTAFGGLFLALYFLASMIRTGGSWASVGAVRRHWSFEFWLNDNLYTFSMVLSVIGAAGCVWMLSRDHERIPVTISVILLALVVPFLVAFVVV